MAIALSSVAIVVNEPICGPYMAGMLKSHAWSERTNQFWTSLHPVPGTESCP